MQQRNCCIFVEKCKQLRHCDKHHVSEAFPRKLQNNVFGVRFWHSGNLNRKIKSKDAL